MDRLTVTFWVRVCGWAPVVLGGATALAVAALRVACRRLFDVDPLSSPNVVETAAELAQEVDRALVIAAGVAAVVGVLLLLASLARRRPPENDGQRA